MYQVLKDLFLRLLFWLPLVLRSVLVSLVFHHKIPQIGGLNNRNFFSYSSSGWKPKVKVIILHITLSSYISQRCIIYLTPFMKHTLVYHTLVPWDLKIDQICSLTSQTLPVAAYGGWRRAEHRQNLEHNVINTLIEMCMRRGMEIQVREQWILPGEAGHREQQIGHFSGSLKNE